MGGYGRRLDETCRAAALAAKIKSEEERDAWIRQAAATFPLAVIGRIFGMARQRVWEIVRAGRAGEA